MSGLLHALVIVAVVALVAARQFSAQRITAEKCWWILPAVLLFVSVRRADALDPRHEALFWRAQWVRQFHGVATGDELHSVVAGGMPVRSVCKDSV